MLLQVNNQQLSQNQAHSMFYSYIIQNITLLSIYIYI